MCHCDKHLIRILPKIRSLLTESLRITATSFEMVISHRSSINCLLIRLGAVWRMWSSTTKKLKKTWFKNMSLQVSRWQLDSKTKRSFRCFLAEGISRIKRKHNYKPKFLILTQFGYSMFCSRFCFVFNVCTNVNMILPSHFLVTQPWAYQAS